MSDESKARMSDEKPLLQDEGGHALAQDGALPAAASNVGGVVARSESRPGKHERDDEPDEVGNKRPRTQGAKAVGTKLPEEHQAPQVLPAASALNERGAAQQGGKVTVLYQINGKDAIVGVQVDAGSSWPEVANAIFTHAGLEHKKVTRPEMQLFAGKLVQKGDEERIDKGKKLGSRGKVPADQAEQVVYVTAPTTTPVNFASLQHQQLTKKGDSAVVAYLKVGEKLARTMRAQDIQKALQEVANEKRNPKPFVVIDNSSGEGKTEVVCYACPDDWRCVYLLLVEVNGRSQPFYQAFKNESKEFVNALEEDFQSIPSDARGARLSVETILDRRDDTYWSLAVVAKLAGFKARAAMTVAEFSALGETVAVFLDEVQEIGNDRLRLARNLLRAAGVVTVLLGTNTNAINLVYTAAAASREGEREGEEEDTPVWARVIVKLPSTDLEAIPERPSWLRVEQQQQLSAAKQFMKLAVETARPWFAHVLCQELTSTEEGDDAAAWITKVFAAAARRVRDSKGRVFASNAVSFLLGQCGLFQEQSRRGADLSEHSNLLKAHFCHVDFGNSEATFVDFELFDNRVALKGECRPWDPHVVFPTPQEEPALYLMLMETNEFAFFHFKRWKRCSVREVLGIREDDKKEHIRVAVSNPSAQKRDGNELEALASMAVIAASHQDGLKGVSFSRFLAGFASELQLKWSEVRAKDDLWGAVGLARDVVVPFLFPDDPPALLCDVPGVNVGKWTRPKDKERVDGLNDGPSGPVVTLECKNHQNPVGVGEFRDKILPGATEHGRAAFHLVVCPKLARLEPESTEELHRQFSHLSVWVAKVGNGVLELEELVASAGSRPVIVFQTESE